MNNSDAINSKRAAAKAAHREWEQDPDNIDKLRAASLAQLEVLKAAARR